VLLSRGQVGKGREEGLTTPVPKGLTKLAGLRARDPVLTNRFPGKGGKEASNQDWGQGQKTGGVW